MKALIRPIGIAIALALSPQNLLGQSMPVAPIFATRVSDKPVRFTDVSPPRRFVTHHKTKIRGKPFGYVATAGETVIASIAGEPVANIFSFSYVKEGHPDPTRPVLFVFNGGPGSSSLWLHVGALGPKRVVLDREINPSNVPPFGLTDNPDTPLDIADLVFIDPVGTGFSHAIGNARDSDFYGVDQDADSIARFIERWLTENKRWNSPRFILGESYGSVRASVLPRALMGGVTYGGVMRGITLNGVILVSVAIGGRAPPVPPGPSGAPDPSTLSLPSLAITALFHGKVTAPGRSPIQLYEEVKRFGATDYATALAAIDAGTLGATDKSAIADRLAGYTGIPASTWISHNLKSDPIAFAHEILADRGLDIGLYDSRYTLPSANAGGDIVADDPAMTQYVPGFVTSFNELIGNDLRVDMPYPYGAIVWEGPYTGWTSQRAGVPPGQDYAQDLAIAMRRNPHLRLMVATGYYDLLTTPAAAESQVLRRIPADRVTFHSYESGHMLYLGGTASQFSDDIRKFITASHP